MLNSFFEDLELAVYTKMRLNEKKINNYDLKSDTYLSIFNLYLLWIKKLKHI